MINIKTKQFEQTFENVGSITITHNLGEYIDYASAFDENNNPINVVSISNTSKDECVVEFDNEYTGKVYVVSQWLSLTRNDGVEFQIDVNSEGNVIATEII
jgi:hypothetical protein